MSELKNYIKSNLNINKMAEGDKTQASTELADIFKSNRPEDAVKIVADILVEDISPSFVDVDISPLLGDVVTLAQGATVKFRTVKGLVGVVHAKGSYAERTQWSSTLSTVSPELLSVNPEAVLQDLEGGQIGNLADLQASAVETFANTIKGNLWAALKAGKPSADASVATATWNLAAATTRSTLQTAMSTLEDVTTARAIVGRVPAVGAISELVMNDANPSIEDIQRYGLTTRYRALPVLGLKNIKDRADTALIDSSTIFVVGDDAIKTFYVGDFGAIGALDADTLVANFHVYREYALTVIDTTKVYRINLT